MRAQKRGLRVRPDEGGGFNSGEAESVTRDMASVIVVGQGVFDDGIARLEIMALVLGRPFDRRW